MNVVRMLEGTAVYYVVLEFLLNRSLKQKNITFWI